MIDAGFSSWSQIFPKAMKQIKKEVGLKGPVSLIDHRRWKYLASLDGNGWASRLPYLLALGSVVFKQDSRFFAWWYPLIEPNVHFVPLEGNVSNVLGMINWARTHDFVVKNIASNGKKFIHEFLTDSGDVYMCILLRKYASMYIHVDV